MLKRFPLYPLLFTLFPVLSLAAYNIQEIAAREMWRPLGVSLLLGALILGLTRLLVRDRHSAALTALVLLALFFSYGQVYTLLKGIAVNGAAIFRHRTLAPVWGIVALAGGFWIIRRFTRSETVTRWLNLLTALLLIYPVLTISMAVVQKSAAERTAPGQVSEVTATDKNQPDIYYIILDAYGREDVLKNLLDYDNSAFLDELRQRGFYVAGCSQANYAYTEFSLSSSLNYDYLENLDIYQHSTRVARLKHSTLRSFLEARGYKTVAFPTGWNNTELEDADIYPTYKHGFTTLSDFEILVAETTLLRIPTDLARQGMQDAGRSELHRKRIFSALSNLKRLPAQDGNLFVFAHLIIPHPPYSFGPQGEWTDLQGDAFEDYRQAYTSQVTYINREILQVIDIILAESETPPVIILQGDHGPPPELTESPGEKMPVLNAYYLPGVDAQTTLYSSISPVNTFRVVLNTYFGQHLPLLDDRSYYAPNENHEELELTPNLCP